MELFSYFFTFSGYDYFPDKDRIYYPDLSDIRRRRQLAEMKNINKKNNKGVFKVLKRRRQSKMITFEDEFEDDLKDLPLDSEHSKILDRIPDILTPG